MRIGHFEHKPSAAVLALYLAFLAALLSLGTWQMNRAAQKSTILAKASRSAAIDPVSIESLSDVILAAEQHTRVSAVGTYIPDKQFLWDNRVHKGQAGFEVITPVLLNSGVAVLVNRGWVRPGATRENLPDVTLSAELHTQLLEFDGLFSRPSKGLASGVAFEQTGGWPKILQYFDYAAMEQQLGYPLVQGVLQPQTASAPLDRPDLNTANWEPTEVMGPAKHYSYAFQWFAMAVALSVLYVVYNTKRISRDP
jgi:surfeit locus 1 family protein